jgi:hypothetical protein
MIRFSETDTCAINKEILSLIKKKAICAVTACEGQFVSNIFIRPKPNGKLRLIMNLKKLKSSLPSSILKMNS